MTPPTAVITGSTGIAASTARQLAARGHRVFVMSRTASACAALIAELGEAGAGYHAADLQIEEQAEQAFAAAAETLGRIDAVVAVAGGSARRFGDGWLHDMSLDAWKAALGINLTTMFLTARESVRHMRGHGGSLVLTSSVLATSPQPDNFTTHGYGAAKAAITGWTVQLAAAYAADNIRVNAVAPGLIRTPMAQRAAEDEAIQAFAARKQPIAGGMLSPESVAAANVWFVEALDVTGQVLAVDGGWAVTSTS